MPILIQICIVIATIAIAATAVALIRVLGQVRRTAAQVERTMLNVDGAIPTVVLAVEDARGVLDTMNHVAARADRIAGDFEHVGGRAAKLSTLLVDQVLTPASQVAAIVSGVRSGATFLFDGWLKRRRATTPSTGGNHHE